MHSQPVEPMQGRAECQEEELAEAEDDEVAMEAEED